MRPCTPVRTAGRISARRSMLRPNEIPARLSPALHRRGNVGDETLRRGVIIISRGDHIAPCKVSHGISTLRHHSAEGVRRLCVGSADRRLRQAPIAGLVRCPYSLRTHPKGHPHAAEYLEARHPRPGGARTVRGCSDRLDRAGPAGRPSRTETGLSTTTPIRRRAATIITTPILPCAVTNITITTGLTRSPSTVTIIRGPPPGAMTVSSPAPRIAAGPVRSMVASMSGWCSKSSD